MEEAGSNAYTVAHVHAYMGKKWPPTSLASRAFEVCLCKQRVCAKLSFGTLEEAGYRSFIALRQYYRSFFPRLQERVGTLQDAWLFWSRAAGIKPAESHSFITADAIS